MLTGNREILPMPCSSSAGSEKKNPYTPLTGVEFFERFEFVVHAVVVMSSEVETSLAPLFRKISRDSSTPFGITEVHFNSSSFALIFWKFGNCRASSLLSEYWITPFYR